jgi:hypothetical protein
VQPTSAYYFSSNFSETTVQHTLCLSYCALRNTIYTFTLQDKAALLANMDPGAVARLLGLMDPNEAVVLLAALGDGNARLVSQVLSSEERERMMEVRALALWLAEQCAVCMHSGCVELQMLMFSCLMTHACTVGLVSSSQHTSKCAVLSLSSSHVFCVTSCAVQVLQCADCQAGGDFGSRARKKGSFRDHEPETVQRLVNAYEVCQNL